MDGSASAGKSPVCRCSDARPSRLYCAGTGKNRGKYFYGCSAPDRSARCSFVRFLSPPEQAEMERRKRQRDPECESPRTTGDGAPPSREDKRRRVEAAGDCDDKAGNEDRCGVAPGGWGDGRDVDALFASVPLDAIEEEARRRGRDGSERARYPQQSSPVAPEPGDADPIPPASFVGNLVVCTPSAPSHRSSSCGSGDVFRAAHPPACGGPLRLPGAASSPAPSPAGGFSRGSFLVQHAATQTRLPSQRESSFGRAFGSRPLARDDRTSATAQAAVAAGTAGALAGVTCKCKLPDGTAAAASFRVSGSERNKGRQYYCCHLGVKQPGGCDFFAWHDERVRAQDDALAPPEREVAVHDEIYARARGIVSDPPTNDRDARVARLVAVAEARGWRTARASPVDAYYHYKHLRIARGPYDAEDFYVFAGPPAVAAPADEAADANADADADASGRVVMVELQTHGDRPKDDGWIVGGESDLIAFELPDGGWAMLGRKALWRFIDERTSAEREPPAAATAGGTEGGGGGGAADETSRYPREKGGTGRSWHEVRSLVPLQALERYAAGLSSPFPVFERWTLPDVRPAPRPASCCATEVAAAPGGDGASAPIEAPSSLLEEAGMS